MFIFLESRAIISLAFERGLFDSSNTLETAQILSVYGVGIVFVSLKIILMSIFYSLHDTKTPMFNSFISMSINVVLSILLMKHYGVVGLALATTVSTIITFILLYSSLIKKKIDYIAISFITNSCKVIFATFVSGLLILLNKEFIAIYIDSELVNLLLSFTLAIVSYLIIVSLLKIKEIDFIREIIKNKLKKKYTTQ
jgi:putative peptidoglycan lipid II flippase